MIGWLSATLLAGVVMTTAPAGAPASARTPAERHSTSPNVMRHDFHVSYTRMAIEPTVISAQLRLFTDDVTRALVERTRRPSITLNSPEGEAAFRAYLIESFQITVNGRRLVPVVVSSAQDRDMWSYLVTWSSAAPITSLALHNATLFELFDDQQNIVKVKHLASGRESTLFFAGGSRADQIFKA